MISKELQNCFGEIYLGKKSISIDVLFILEILRINCQMDAGEFEGLLYQILSEEPFKNQIFDMTEKNDDYTISYYVSQNFRILIGETWPCLTCHAKKPIKIRLIYYAIGRNIIQIMFLRPIIHERKTHLCKSCVTMTDLMVNFDEKLS